jgi:hypothetical protein
MHRLYSFGGKLGSQGLGFAVHYGGKMGDYLHQPARGKEVNGDVL